MAPACSRQVGPPVKVIAQIHAKVWLAEYHRPRHQHMRQRAWILRCVRYTLGDRNVAGGFNEFLKLRVGDKMAVHPEGAHGFFVYRRLLRIVMVGTHQERAARYPLHSWTGRFSRANRTRRIYTLVGHPRRDHRALTHKHCLAKCFSTSWILTS